MAGLGQISQVGTSSRADVVRDAVAGQRTSGHLGPGGSVSPEESAGRLHVGGPDRAVVLDPAVSSGASTVRGIGTEVLAELASAGTAIDDIAHDISLSRAEVAAALEHEYSQAA